MNCGQRTANETDQLFWDVPGYLICAIGSLKLTGAPQVLDTARLQSETLTCWGCFRTARILN